MSREIKRVPFDFDQPLNKTWQGYIQPGHFTEDDCPNCERGFSPRAEELLDKFHGKAPFHPSETGSTSFTADSEAVMDIARRNLDNAPWFYGTDAFDLIREAHRLAGLFNGRWQHHLTQQDVDVLVEEGRLRNFTHTFSREHGWQKINPPVRPTATQVNGWSVSGLGHDEVNAMLIVEARCEREGVDPICATCGGHASLESYPGQRAEAEAWEPTEPPVGDGWQVWETVGLGSPISPVFRTREQLVDWLMSPAYNWGISTPLSRDEAERFADTGWAMTMVGRDSDGEIVTTVR